MDEHLTFNAAPDELQVFIAENEELLVALDAAVLRLERDPADHDLLQEIFRITHTIKGSSATIGHDPMTGLAHNLETLLGELRAGRLVATRETIDVLLASLDALRALAGEVRTQTRSGLDPAPLQARLAAACRSIEVGAPRAPADVAEPAAIAEAEIDGLQLVRVAVRFTDEAPMPAVRALQVLITLEDGGHVLSSRPTREQIEGEDVGREIDVLVATMDGPEQIRALLLPLADVAAIDARLERVSPPEAAQRHEPAAEAPPEPAGGEAASQRMQRLANTVRIDVARLDALMNLVGELVIDRALLQNIALRAEAMGGDRTILDGLASTALHLERITDEMQAEVMKARMLPVEHVFSRFPRVVRDLARRFDKDAELILEGRDTELDRSVIEELNEPLVHLVRNAIDHGIESPEERTAAGKPPTGTIRLTARHEAGQIVVEVADDGRGIDPERIRRAAVAAGLTSGHEASQLDDAEAANLIFEPGLTTARAVSDVSGRGVGMDIVRAGLERLSGSIAIDTKVGQGTTFTIRLPLTLAIVRALLVEASDLVYAVPISSVVETVRVDHDELRWVNRRAVVHMRGALLPLTPLAELLRHPSRGGAEASLSGRRDGRVLAVAVQHGSRKLGLVVDHLVGEQEIVIKPLEPLIGEIDGIAGTAVLGDGRIAPILYVPGLIKDVVQPNRPEALFAATA